MTLILNVDGDAWRDHLRRTADAYPGIVPVAKGNGYGLGNHRLARRAAWLGVDTLAVGTYAELDQVADRCDSDLLVLTPWRDFLATSLLSASDRVIHTVGRLQDLEALAARPGRPRVVLERITTMRRHGFTAAGLREAARVVATSDLQAEGVAAHLPLPGPESVREAEEVVIDALAAGLGSDGPLGSTVWLSHLTSGEVSGLAAAYPDLRFRPRVGTELWLGAPDAFRVTARVIDAHPVDRGERYGYRRRRAPRAGTLLIVSGGTGHGIGLEAPTGRTGVRARGATLARGGLDAAGFARSPYVVAGKHRFFAEPPHMQASMLFLPSGVPVPAIGDEIPVRVRHTTTTFDAVEIS